MAIRKILNQPRKMYLAFSTNYKPFGFCVAWYKMIDVLTARIPMTALGNYISQKKHKSILNYLEQHYNNEIQEIAKIVSELHSNANTPLRIWQCWWQGEQYLEGITKICTNSVKENAQNIPITIITFDNYRKYAEIPQIIIDKYEKGLVTLTELSDILRTNLLWKWGGLWIDATILVTDKIADDFTKSDFITCKEICHNNTFVSKYKWNTSFMGGKQGLPLYAFVSKMFEVYWQNENKLIDYYLLDYLIALGYKHVQSIKNEIDNVHPNNPHKHVLQSLLNKSFSSEKWKDLTTDTKVFKLSRKATIPYKTFDENGNKTFYGYITEKYKK